MRRFILSLLAVVGCLAVPMTAAAAEPEWIWVRYGDTWVRYPSPSDVYYLPTTYTVTPPRVVRTVPIELGASCSALNDQVIFAPASTMLDAYDRASLDSLGLCLSRGPLAGARFQILAGYDGSASSLAWAHQRQSRVIDHLTMMGVSPAQITVALDFAPAYRSNHVRFRLTSR